MGSFLLGVTPLGVTAIAVATSVASISETFRPESVPVDLSCYNELQPSNIKFFIGVDISQSFLRKGTDTHAQVCEVLRRMLRRDEAIEWHGYAAAPTATAEIWHFGTTSVQVEQLSAGRFADPWISELAALCLQPEEIASTSTSQSLNTDVLGFLEAIESDVGNALMKGERAVVILFSDFLQDAGEKDYQVEQRLRDLAVRLYASHRAGREVEPDNETRPYALECREDLGFTRRLVILGLTVEPHEQRSSWSGPRAIDLVPLLAHRLPDHFRKIDLVDLLGPQSPHSVMPLAGATSGEIRVDMGDPLFIKYRLDNSDRANPLEAEILNALPPPGEDDRPTDIAIQVRPYPGGGSLPPIVQFRYAVDHGAPSLLTSYQGIPSAWHVEQVARDQPGTIRIWLDSPLDVSRAAHLELLLALPRRGIFYAIPVTIVPVLGTSALEIFDYLVYFFGACAVGLALSHGWSSRDSPVWQDLAAMAQWRTLVGKAAGWGVTILSRVRDRCVAPASLSSSPAQPGDDKPAAGGPT